METLNYCVFICTHGRPSAQHTYKALREAGYTGDVIVVIDDEDATAFEYRERYHGEPNVKVMMFCKQDEIDGADTGISVPKRNAILYAKRACERYALKMNLDAFVIADDDITGFRYRYDDCGKLCSQRLTFDLDSVLQHHFEFMLSCNICATSFGTAQMYIGGLSLRQCCDSRVPFNFVLRNSSIRFEWRSEIYEDSISSIIEAINGKYQLQLPFVQLEMVPLYSGKCGGMSELYDRVGSFEKVFPVIKYMPSCMVITAGKSRPIYSIHKDRAYPKLVSSFYKKSY